jgi:hypothetical protein|tara:strand:- start:549 stop:1163 length:615 start_codon:yes stop_codon:yes gene_type:complete
MTQSKELGATTSPGPWVQVERKAMEQWAALIAESPAAGQLLMTMVARMGRGNALVASQQALTEASNLSLSSVKRAIKLLKDRRFVEIVQIGPTRSSSAYVINSRVAWSGKREGMRQSMFHAVVLASESDQKEIDTDELKHLPEIFTGEQQLPVGDGLEPPSEPAIPGLEHDLPARQAEHHQTDLEDFTGNPVMIDRDTGEIIED